MTARCATLRGLEKGEKNQSLSFGNAGTLAVTISPKQRNDVIHDRY